MEFQFEEYTAWARLAGTSVEAAESDSLRRGQLVPGGGRSARRRGRDRGLDHARLGGAARALAGLVDRPVVGGADVIDLGLDQGALVHRTLARSVVHRPALRTLPDLLLVGEVLDLAGGRGGNGVDLDRLPGRLSGRAILGSATGECAESDGNEQHAHESDPPLFKKVHLWKCRSYRERDFPRVSKASATRSEDCQAVRPIYRVGPEDTAERSAFSRNVGGRRCFVACSKA